MPCPAHNNRVHRDGEDRAARDAGVSDKESTMKIQMLVIGILIGLLIGVFIGKNLLKPNQHQIVKCINDMDVVELSNLVKVLETKFGVSAAAPKATVIEYEDKGNGNSKE